MFSLHRVSTKIFPSIFFVYNKFQKAMLSNKISTRIQLSVLDNGAMMAPTIVLATDTATHLFNCVEGTQRLLEEYNKISKLCRVKKVFFTSTRYENWSGFFGLLLTLSSRRDAITCYGHSHFNDIIKIYRQFLVNASHLELNHVSTDVLTQFENLNDDDNFLIRSISHERSTAYLIIAKDKVGKLLIEKCKEFKIPPGPKFATLKNGSSIEIDGRTIKPEDVLGPPEPGKSFLIFECFQHEHLDNFLRKLENLSQFTEGKELELIIHMSPEKVIKDTNYRKWLQNFSPNVTHIFLNENSNYCSGLVASTELQMKLNLIDNQIFKLLNEKQSSFDIKNENMIDNCPNLLTYFIRSPRKDEKKIGILESNGCQVNQEEIQNQMISIPDFPRRLDLYRTIIEKSKQTEKNGQYPNILFLGTGSAIPGKLRNTSSILINLNDKKSILFDCGEATFIQMNRFFGLHQVHEALAKINAIFISHYHPDHHFGLIKLINERSKIPRNLDPLEIIAPYSIISFLHSFDDKLEILFPHFNCVPCETLSFHQNQSNESSNKRSLLKKIGLDNLMTVKVPHCVESYGIVIITDGKKICYSGDSMYSDSFDEAGKCCDLMIHEATMNDDLLEEAEKKRHSTISQAINVGRKIEAKYTLLTHFSQRYHRMAPINLIEDPSLASYIEENVIIAFDFMQVSLDDLWKAAKLKSPLEVLFNEEIQKMQEKAKRNLKRKIMLELT